MLKNKGPNLEPCDIPVFISSKPDSEFPYCTYSVFITSNAQAT